MRRDEGWHNSLAKWTALAASWDIAAPPASPSADDLRNYRSLLGPTPSTRGDTRALLLGVTPSLRWLLTDAGFEVTCVDINEEMVASSLASLSLQPGERMIVESWLSFSDQAGGFSSVLGDKVLDNVEFPQWRSLNDRMDRLLQPLGCFVTRISPVQHDLLGVSFAELLSRWGLSLANGEVDLTTAASGLWEHGLGASTDAVPGTQSLSRFDAEIDALRGRTTLSTTERAVLQRFLEIFEQTLDHRWTAYAVDDVLDTFSGTFSLAGTLHSSDYAAASRQPIMAFQAQPQTSIATDHHPAVATTRREQA